MPWLNEKIRLSTIDFFKNTKIKHYYYLFTDSFHWTREQIETYRLNKLIGLLKHAQKNVPYYEVLFKNIGFNPEGIKHCDQISVIPTLTRELISENFSILYDKELLKKKVYKSSSSGTTGIPVNYIHDNDGESAGIAAGYALFNLSGWFPGKRNIHIWGNPESVKKWDSLKSKIKRKVLNHYFYPASLLNDPDNYIKLLNIIKNFRPDYIDGYASTISGFSQWLYTNNIKISGIKAVFTTAENLPEYQKYFITETLGPISDLYGCGEINGIAVKPVGLNNYYILDTHVYIEIVEKNGINEVLVTDIDNKVMPFIRYKIGDSIDKLTFFDQNENPQFSKFGMIKGRSSDVIRLPDGKVIHPVNLLGGTFIRKFETIKKHKVLWDQKKLYFQFEISSPLDLNALRLEIQKNIEEYNLDFEISFTDRLLPDCNGKFRYFDLIK